MSTIEPMIPPNGTHEPKIDAAEAARFLSAFVECSREVQNIVMEMSAIILDGSSTEDERALASQAIMEALFPGMAADVLETYHKRLKSPEALQTAADLRTEEDEFADRVRSLMVEKNITQDVLAKAAGIGQPAVSNILNRRCRPQRRTVVRFAEALGVPPEELWPHFENQTAQ